MNKNFLIGLVLGILIPIISFVIVVVFYLEYNLTYFVNHKVNDNNLPSIISLTLILNLVFFFIKMNANKEEQSRGILLATILYGIVIVTIKFI